MPLWVPSIDFFPDCQLYPQKVLPGNLYIPLNPLIRVVSSGWTPHAAKSGQQRSSHTSISSGIKTELDFTPGSGFYKDISFIGLLVMAPPSNISLRELDSQSSPESFTTPLLTANLICRVFFGILANMACLVPLKLLHRNREFAAVVFIVAILLINTLHIANALIWRDDNLAGWWSGYGWCDLHVYLYSPLLAVYATCVLAIMRNLADQVGLLRANPLTVGEKKRRNLIQALIIFPLPLLQLALIYPLTAQRYAIGTLVGCSWVVDRSWPVVVFFILPNPILALIAAWYAGKSAIAWLAPTRKDHIILTCSTKF
jgi:hypothetical protein